MFIHFYTWMIVTVLPFFGLLNFRSWKKNEKGEREPEDENDLFRTLISPFCSELYYCYYGDEDASPDDIKDWEIKDELEENLQSGKFRLPAFVKLVFRWDEEDLERTVTLAIDRPAPSGVEEEPK